jgi:hypothetical protein
MHSAVRYPAHSTVPAAFGLYGGSVDTLPRLASQSHPLTRCLSLPLEAAIRGRVYLSAGIHTLAEAEAYDAEKRRRDAERARLRSLGGSGFLGSAATKAAVKSNRTLLRDGATPVAVPVYGAMAAPSPTAAAGGTAGASAPASGANTPAGAEPPH